MKMKMKMMLSGDFFMRPSFKLFVLLFRPIAILAIVSKAAYCVITITKGSAACFASNHISLRVGLLHALVDLALFIFLHAHNLVLVLSHL